MLSLLQQSLLLVLTAVKRRRLCVAELGAIDHEQNEQLLAIATKRSGEFA
jgi:hypothetical protein